MIEYENLGKANESFFDEYRAAFDRVLESGWYVLGNAVKRFEDEFAVFTGARWCSPRANRVQSGFKPATVVSGICKNTQ